MLKIYLSSWLERSCCGRPIPLGLFPSLCCSFSFRGLSQLYALFCCVFYAYLHRVYGLVSLFLFLYGIIYLFLEIRAQSIIFLVCIIGYTASLLSGCGISGVNGLFPCLECFILADVFRVHLLYGFIGHSPLHFSLEYSVKWLLFRPQLCWRKWALYPIFLTSGALAAGHVELLLVWVCILLSTVRNIYRLN